MKKDFHAEVQDLANALLDAMAALVNAGADPAAVLLGGACALGNLSQEVASAQHLDDLLGRLDKTVRSSARMRALVRQAPAGRA